ncbi:uncharacterized protein FA14DRAFT_166767 [Meira miltonrushii]|uniref:Probable methionine--tRNA ligase, mitochondrial n=1 Tax=Meira miltonrushii TaxID=1280837 RepID=A0A316VNJ2_9BASI|nr:uncharacterized protein FA14DRAFT_166767 [Meira miltonrushii]PWN37681.1 hypothetical protein FA14DRAFT_166767 [Meira miltonrushii]
MLCSLTARHALYRWQSSSRLCERLNASTTRNFSLTACRLTSKEETQLIGKPYYITTPIFYVNAVPHIGHLQSMVLADVLAKWNQWRHKGWSPSKILEAPENTGTAKVIFATGTDEHGGKIQKAAEKLGESPRQLCDRVSKRFNDLADAAGVEYTRFIRTTDTDHIETVKTLWDQLLRDGFIYKGTHSGWYSVVDEAFYTQTQVKQSEEDSKLMVSIETGNVVEWTEEENFKFRLSLFEEPIRTWLKGHSARIVPYTRYQATLQELDEGLQDLSISRPKSRLQWGIEVPNDSEQTMYVWFDALLNYVTVSGYPWNGAKAGGEEVLGSWPADTQIVGKDIIRFHAIYFPAFLMALGLPLPRQLVTHGHWTVNMSKMSKSKGNAVNPFIALKTVGVEELRFFLTRVGGNLGKDVNWNDETLVEFRKKHLQSNYGNLLSRVLAPTLLQRLIPEGKDEVTISAPELLHLKDQEHLRLLSPLADTVDINMAQFEISKALSAILHMLESSQRHWHSIEPWKKSIRDDETNLWRAVYLTMESLRIAALLSKSVMPNKMNEMLDLLGIPKDERSFEHAKELRKEITLCRSSKKVQPLFPGLSTTAKTVVQKGAKAAKL